MSIAFGCSPEIVELIEALGLDPKVTRNVTIELPSDDVVIIHHERYATKEQIERLGKKFGELLKTPGKYVLVNKEDLQ